MSLLDTYTPRLPADEWELIRPFTLEVVTEVAGRVAYGPQRIVRAVTHHIHWAVNLQGLPLTREVLFRKDVISVYVEQLRSATAQTRGTIRALLLRVGETLGVIELEPYLPPIGNSDAPPPYSDTEVSLLRFWAHHQPNPERDSSARALLALGLGAGLTTREIAGARACDVLERGRFIQTCLPNARIVRVDLPFAAELENLAALSGSPDEYLFRPGAVWAGNIVSNFVRSPRAHLAVLPHPQRMRSTWIVARLTQGMPAQELLYQAGLQTLGAFERFQAFLPAVQPPLSHSAPKPPAPRPRSRTAPQRPEQGD